MDLNLELAYFIIETVIFCLVLTLTFGTLKKLKANKSQLRIYILSFLIMNAFSILFSAIAKFMKFYFQLYPSEQIIFSDNYGLNLILFGRIKYTANIFANLSFFFASYELFSRPQTIYTRIVTHLTTIITTLYLIPNSSSTFSLVLSICLFVHSILVYLPISIVAYQKIALSKKNTKKMMKLTFYLALSLNSTLLFALLDRVWNLFIRHESSPFYFLGWLGVLFGIIFAFKLFVFSDWRQFQLPKQSKEFIDRDKTSSNLHGPLMLIMCPICRETKYRIISKNAQEKVSTNPGGIATMLINKNDICPHTFVVYYDKNFKVRNTQPLDVSD